MKIAIAGPGRSGTTFLTQFFKELSFVVPAGEIHKDARAGLESRISADSPYEVDKDLWCHEYVDRIPVANLQKYKFFLIPIRNLDDAAMSRSVQERVFRATSVADDTWKWNCFGNVPGGAVSDTSIKGIRLTLLKGL